MIYYFLVLNFYFDSTSNPRLSIPWLIARCYTYVLIHVAVKSSSPYMWTSLFETFQQYLLDSWLYIFGWDKNSIAIAECIDSK